MLHIYSFFVALLCFFNISLLAEAITQRQDQPTPYKSEIPQSVRETINTNCSQEQSESTKKIDILRDEDMEEMEIIFESSPEKARDIVKYLQDPTYFPSNVNFRSAFFVGETGSGKTKTAEIIVHKMAQNGWEYKIISSTSLLGEYRNQTAIQLAEELDAAVSTDKPTIVVIDELHRLLENTDSKHHDTDTTATVLWTFLDKQEHNKKFFFIGTMNRVDKLPKPFKDRIFPGYIPFTLVTDSKTKNKLVRKHLTTPNTRLDASITDTFLDKELEKIGQCSGRSLKLMCHNILMMHKGNKEKEPVLIKKEFIIRAINEHIRDKATMDYDAKDETDEERQDRHHRENLEQQRKYHEEQMQFQKKNQEMQHKQSIAQQKMQLELVEYQYSLTHRNIFVDQTPECQKAINSILSGLEKMQ